MQQERRHAPRVFKKADPDFPPFASHFTQRERLSIMLFSQPHVRRSASNCSAKNAVHEIVVSPLSKEYDGVTFVRYLMSSSGLISSKLMTPQVESPATDISSGMNDSLPSGVCAFLCSRSDLASALR